MPNIISTTVDMVVLVLTTIGYMPNIISTTVDVMYPSATKFVAICLI